MCIRRYLFPVGAHYQVGRQDVQIIRCRKVHLIIEEVTDQLGMQWRGGRVSGEGFTKERMLELGIEGCVVVYQVVSGRRAFQTRGTACMKVSLRSLKHLEWHFSSLSLEY